MGSLREEISGLRSSLLEQMSAFHDEKSRWEQEKLKVVDYQKLLQENYVEMFRRNKSLEQQLMQLTEEVDRTSNKSSQSPALSLSRMSCNSDTVPTAIPSLQQQLQSNDNSSIKSDSPSIKPPTS